MTPARPGPQAGRRIVQASWAGTLALTVTSLLATLVRSTSVVALGVALALFGAGLVAFAAAYVRAVARSRTEEVGVGGVFLLEGSAPAGVRRRLLGSAATEAAVAVATAALHPNTSLAFGILTPLYGLGLAGLWGARNGTFPPRTAPEPRRRPRS